MPILGHADLAWRNSEVWFHCVLFWFNWWKLKAKRTNLQHIQRTIPSGHIIAASVTPLCVSILEW